MNDLKGTTYNNKSLYVIGCLFFFFLSIAAGGGNYPGLQAGKIIYLKAIAMGLPCLYAFFLFWRKKFSFATAFKQSLCVHKYLYFYLAFCFCSLPMAFSLDYSLNRLLYTCFGIAGVFCLANMLKIKSEAQAVDKQTLSLSFLYIALLIVFSGCYLSGFALGDSFRQSFQQLGLTHPNILSSFLLQILFVVLYSDLLSKNLKIVCTSLLSVFIFLLFSRSVLLSFLLVVVMIQFIKNDKKKLFYMSVAFGIILCFGVLLTSFSPLSGLYGLISRGNDIEALYTLTNRTLVWKKLFDTVDWKMLLFGNGYGVVTKNYGIDFGTGILYGAHNSYLSILFGSGVFALLCFLLFCMTALVRHIRLYKIDHHKKHLSFIACLLTFLINSMTAEEVGVNITANFAFLLFLSYSMHQDQSKKI